MRTPSDQFPDSASLIEDGIMGRKLLQLFPGMCRHEFGWPRRTSEGDYYQVCLLCGDEYQYDWRTMRRLRKRVEHVHEKQENVSHRTSWAPRARRLKVPIAVQFRAQVGDRVPGTIENLSQSGLFIRSEQMPAKGELIEMIFEMPVEISGQENAEVLCVGQVVRLISTTEQVAASGFAVSIIDYRFLHRDGRPSGPTGAARDATP